MALWVRLYQSVSRWVRGSVDWWVGVLVGGVGVGVGGGGGKGCCEV